MRHLAVALMSVGTLLAVACSHPQNLERKDPLTDEVTGSLAPTDRAFLKDDPATKLACRADAQCPKGALCHPEKRVCFTSSPPPDKIKVDLQCPLVPVYFALDSTDLVPEANKWIDHDARCLRARGATGVAVTGYADVRGESDYNVDLSRRRAEAVKTALANHGIDVDVAVEGAGESTLIKGTTEHDYAYNRRVELESK